MAETCDVGDSRTITITFTNNAGVATNPSSVTFRLKDPTGTVTTPAATNSATGVYTITLNFNIAGRWYYRWETDTTFGVAEQDVMDVLPSYFE